MLDIHANCQNNQDSFISAEIYVALETASNTVVDSNAEISKNIIALEKEEASLYLKLSPIISLFALSNIWLEQDRSDFEQDVFLILLENLKQGKIKNISSIDSFCRGICKNHLLQYIRKQKRHTERFCPLDDECADEANSAMNHVEKDVALLTSSKLSDQCINALKGLKKERDSQILIEHILYEKSPGELAEKYDLTEAHFYRVLFRAKARAKLELACVAEVMA